MAVVGNAPVQAQFDSLHDFLKAGLGLRDCLMRLAADVGGRPGAQAEMPAEHAVFELQGAGGRQGERLAETAGDAAIGQRVAAEESIATGHRQVEHGAELPPGQAGELPADGDGVAVQRIGLVNVRPAEVQAVGAVIGERCAIQFVAPERARQVVRHDVGAADWVLETNDVVRRGQCRRRGAGFHPG